MVFDDAPSISIAGSSLETRHRRGGSCSEGRAWRRRKGKPARLIKQGGLYVNDRRLTDERGQITMADAIERSVIVLRKGQRERRIVKIEG